MAHEFKAGDRVERLPEYLDIPSRSNWEKGKAYTVRVGNNQWGEIQLVEIIGYYSVSRFTHAGPAEPVNLNDFL